MKAGVLQRTGSRGRQAEGAAGPTQPSLSLNSAAEANTCDARPRQDLCFQLMPFRPRQILVLSRQQRVRPLAAALGRQGAHGGGGGGL
jgi:hypothetical protein